MVAVSPAVALVAAAAFVAASVVDARRRIVPNACVAVAAAARLVELAAAVLAGAPLSALAYYLGSAFGLGVGLLAFTLVFDRLTGTDGMGGGDIKLYAVAGLYLGWEWGLVVVAASCVLGALWGLASGAAGRLRSGRRAAFRTARRGEAGGSPAPEAREGVLAHTLAFAPFISIATFAALIIAN